MENAADSSNGSSGTQSHVVVNTSHSGHTIIDSDAASSSTGTIVSESPHYITVTGKLIFFFYYLLITYL